MSLIEAALHTHSQMLTIVLSSRARDVEILKHEKKRRNNRE